ncbi:uncharacterized protein [Typha angustifolia]|uniref:uncharacterized protein n=1 Tax=Typha angustifolia TaxID=59011 RepID=UPI003C2D1B37
MSPKKPHHDDLSLEVSVLSAESLKKPSPLLLCSRLRPYVTLSSSATSSDDAALRTRVDEVGADSPKWGDTLVVPVGPSFLRTGSDDSVYVSVLSRRRFAGPASLGWCRIASADVVDGLRPPTVRRRLSYALRSPRHGGRGHGVIRMAVRLLGRQADKIQAPAASPPEPGWCRMAIGIPVAAGFPAASSSWVPRGGTAGGLF